MLAAAHIESIKTIIIVIAVLAALFGKWVLRTVLTIAAILIAVLLGIGAYLLLVGIHVPL